MVFRITALAAAMAATLSAQTGPGTGQAPPKPVPTVAFKALEPLLPDMRGWTKGPVGGNRVAIAADCDYMFADAVYTKGRMKVRVTLADSGFNADSLMSLAPMVVGLPADYSEEIAPATVIKRFEFAGSPAASRWDGDNNEGEFTVLVGGRFAALAEGTHLDRIDTLREFVALVDLKKLAELK